TLAPWLMKRLAWHQMVWLTDRLCAELEFGPKIRRNCLIRQLLCIAAVTAAYHHGTVLHLLRSLSPLSPTCTSCPALPPSCLDGEARQSIPYHPSSSAGTVTRQTSHRAGSAPPTAPGSGHACRSGWWSRPGARATPERCGCPCPLPAGVWRTSGGGCGGPPV